METLNYLKMKNRKTGHCLVCQLILPLSHLTRPSLFSSILLNSSRALLTLELSVPIISYTADTTLKNQLFIR